MGHSASNMMSELRTLNQVSTVFWHVNLYLRPMWCHIKYHGTSPRASADCCVNHICPTIMYGL